MRFLLYRLKVIAREKPDGKTGIFILRFLFSIANKAEIVLHIDHPKSSLLKIILYSSISNILNISSGANGHK